MKRATLLLFVLVMGACSLLPLPSRSASIELTWEDDGTITTLPDGNVADNRPTHANVYRQTATTQGIQFPGLPLRWIKIGEAPRTSVDENTSIPGFTQKFVVPNVNAGNHSFVVTLQNSAGTTGPSNVATVTVVATTTVVAPPVATGLGARQIP